MSDAMKLGSRFGMLKVESFAGVFNGRRLWTCLCDCGNLKEVCTGDLNGGRVQSCGCAYRKHGQSNGTLYRIWKSMRDRCSNPHNKRYARYGGRGITVCERWDSFVLFKVDMGERPAGMTLERIDNNKGYCKENCRWATLKEQANNRGNSRHITFNGQTKTLAQWAAEIGMTWEALESRLARGWSVARAITEPLGAYFKNSRGSVN